MMGIDQRVKQLYAAQRVKRGWFCVAVVALCGYGIRTVFDVQGETMAVAFSVGLTIVVVGLFVAQVVISWIVEDTRDE